MTQDIDKLVAELLVPWEATDAPVAKKVNRFIRERKQAADALATLAKRLEEAEAVIRPFAAIASAVFYVDEDGREMNANRGDDHAVWGFDRKELTYGNLRAARRWMEDK